MIISGASAEEMGRMMAAYPLMKDALAKLSAEGQKLSGTPISTTMTFDAVKSAEEVAQEAKQAEKSESGEKDSDPTSVGGLLGGLARRAAQRRANNNNNNNNSNQNANKGRLTIMTSTTEFLKISPEVSAADLSIPAGFKENR
jgi:hypothetical protein